MSKQTKTFSRNWTKVETFCEILVDPINNFMQTLEQKASKKPQQRKFTMQKLLKLKKRWKQSRSNQEMLHAAKIKAMLSH